MATPFTVAPEAFGDVGHGPVQPECVLATAAGDLHVSHGGSISHIAADGTTRHVPADAEERPKVNGIAMLRDGSFLLANVACPGGLFHLDRNGALRRELAEIDGVPLTPCNFAGIDPPVAYLDHRVDAPRAARKGLQRVHPIGYRQRLCRAGR